ncbi:MAG: tyrosine-type recombinase/integrase [Bacillota bacterium]|nr:tyrosine-type recombinase/integrase [Bacillota bacterium]
MASIKKKRKKNWVVRYDIIEGKSGKRVQKQKSGFQSKEEAEFFLADLLMKKDKKEVVEPSKEPFSTYINWWFNNVYKLEVEGTTAENQKYMLTKHLVPYFDRIPICKITPSDLNVFYATKLEEGKSKKTVKDLHHILSKAFSNAVEQGLLIENPAIKATAPKPHTKAVDPWRYEEVVEFILGTRNVENYSLYVTAVNTGMRRGEILALRWNDVDFDKRTLSISRNLAFTKSKGLFVKVPKTKASMRTIDVSDSLLEELLLHKERQGKWKKSLGSAYQENNLVFPNMYGNFKDPRNLLREFYLDQKFAQVRMITFHDLRHTHATLLLINGENPKLVQQRLGHEDVEITLRIYSHILPSMQRDAVNKLEQELNNRFH